MPDPHAFDRIAAEYQRYRPRYPDEVLAELRAVPLVAPAGGRPLIVDAGSGTGISTRLLRRVFGPEPLVLGVEPNEDMLREAAAETPPELGIEYVAGLAEALPSPQGAVSLVLAAQALQWFDRPAFYAEARRVLAPGGTLAILQNNRAWEQSAAVEAYEQFLEAHSPGYSRFYRAFDVEGELEALDGFEAAPPFAVTWTRRMSLEGFVGMARSSTKMQGAIRALGAERALELLTASIAPHAHGQTVDVPYRTELFRARRA
jgi:SAM-dependent methyltransferase